MVVVLPKYLQVKEIRDGNMILVGAQEDFDEDSDYDENSDSDLDEDQDGLYYEDFSETEDTDSEDL